MTVLCERPEPGLRSRAPRPRACYDSAVTDTVRILERVAAGESAAVDELLPQLYDEMRGIAARLFRAADWNSTLAPTAVVHEAYLRMVGNQPDGWNGKSHFLGLAANVMRQVLVDHHRRRAAAKRGGGWDRVTLSGAAPLVSEDPVDFVALEEALVELEALDPRQAKVVELRFFAGLTVGDVAALLGVSRSSVELDWRHARAWLRGRLGGAP